MPLILGAQSATAAGGYQVENSCWFNGTSQGLVRTNPATAVTLGTKSTVSFWAKRTLPNSTGTNQFYSYTNGGSSPYNQMYWQSGGGFQWQNHDTTTNTSLVTTQLFHDPSAWYHMVFSYDSTPATPSSTSIKMFVNGVQVTAFSDETYPAQNVVSQVCKPSVNFPICYYPSTAWYSGHYAEIMVVDGQALDADQFGEFNEDSPTIWQPIDISGIDVGNLGCYLEFKDSASLGTDTSGIGNFTATGLAAINQSQDTPTNNWCKMNPLDNYKPVSTFTLADLKIVTSSSAYTFNTGTMGLSAGKWYFEVLNVVSSDSNKNLIGISGMVSDSGDNYLGEDAFGWGYYGADGNVYNAGASSSYGTAYANGDLVGVYIDLDNNKLYTAENGVINNSGTGISITAAASTPNQQYFPAVGDFAAGGTAATFEVNFGNPVAALTSAVADVNGYGRFEYSPNDGGSASFDGSAKDFLAICSKNLGTDGG